jgi:hypothetical protein
MNVYQVHDEDGDTWIVEAESFEDCVRWWKAHIIENTDADEDYSPTMVVLLCDHPVITADRLGVGHQAHPK